MSIAPPRPGRRSRPLYRPIDASPSDDRQAVREFVFAETEGHELASHWTACENSASGRVRLCLDKAALIGPGGPRCCDGKGAEGRLTGLSGWNCGPKRRFDASVSPTSWSVSSAIGKRWPSQWPGEKGQRVEPHSRRSEIKGGRRRPRNS